MAAPGPADDPTARLASTPARLGELLELAPIAAIVRVFGSDEIVYWSRGAEELYGWSASEAAGRVTHTLLQTQFPVSKAAVDDSLRSVGQWSGELVHTRRDGQQVVVVSRQVVQRSEQSEQSEHGEPSATLELNTDITYRRLLEENLHQSEERFRLLVTNVQDYAIFLLSPAGDVLTWNDGAQRLKGYAPEEIIGQSFTRFYTPEAIAAGLPEQLLGRAARDGRVQHEGWRVRKDGSRFWAEVVMTALRDSSGKLRGFAKITRDLTERRQAEEARRRASREEGARAAAEAAAQQIRASHDQLAAILDGVAEGVTAIEPSGRMLFANDEAARLCGFATAQDLLDASRGEIFGRFELLDESGVPYPAERLPTRRALAGMSPAEDLIRFRVRSTGEERWSLVNASAITDASGSGLMAVTIFRDVTERHLAEAANRFVAAVNLELTRSLEYTQTLQRVAELSVSMLGDWCTVDIVENERVQRVAVVPHDLDQSVLPDPQRLVRVATPVLLPEASEHDLEPFARDASHLTALRTLPIRSLMTVPLIGRGQKLGAITFMTTESGRRLGSRQLAIAEDLAVRAALALDNGRLYREAQQQTALHVELNAALRDTMLQLQQALATRDEFLASVSHDLKNPIASIKGMAQLLERRIARLGTVPMEQLSETLVRIDAVATRAASQVEELLDLARMRLDRPLDLDRDAVDLVDLARNLVEEHRHRSDRNPIHLTSSMPALVGRWDGRRLSRALANILDNAIKYSPDGTDVEVRVAPDGSDPSGAVISVADHGIGIPSADLERIFDRFQRGSNVTGRVSGTGIGLASAQHIVQSHGGTITAESQPDHGTTITIHLPLQEREQ